MHAGVEVPGGRTLPRSSSAQRPAPSKVNICAHARHQADAADTRGTPFRSASPLLCSSNGLVSHPSLFGLDSSVGNRETQGEKCVPFRRSGWALRTELPPREPRWAGMASGWGLFDLRLGSWQPPTDSPAVSIQGAHTGPPDRHAGWGQACGPSAVRGGSRCQLQRTGSELPLVSAENRVVWP